MPSAIGNGMAGFDQLDAMKRKTMAVFRDHEPAGNVASKDFLNHLSHAPARLAGPDNDQLAAYLQFLAADPQDVVVDLHKIANTRGGIGSVQSGLPNHSRGLTQFADVH